jgi:methyltransferase (TIGR00027 family)
MTGGDAPTGVGETAIGAALMRAEERQQPDPLFEDPLAEAFVAAAPAVFADGPEPDDPEIMALAAAFQQNIAIRTRFYDDFLRDATAHRCRQVVLVAAGLDARAFRIPWPTGVTLFELDLPGVLAFKDRVVATEGATPTCDRRGVGVDLRDDWPAALTERGFDVAAPTAWTAEGLLTYLSHDDTVQLLERITTLSRAGSRFATEAARIGDDATLLRARATGSLEHVSDLWQGGMDEDPGAWLAGRGWAVAEHDRSDLAASYSRSVSDSSSGGFLTATRIDP